MWKLKKIHQPFYTQFNMKHTKQIIIMRNDLNMRKGKMCAQASHVTDICSFFLN